MKRLALGSVLVFFVCWPLDGAHGQGQIFPTRVLPADLSLPPYSSTGLVETAIGSSAFSGSGSVARDPRLLFTCAHVLYDRGTWADTVAFHRAYHSSSGPSGAGVVARGYHYVSGYADAAIFPFDFDKDFAVAYSSPAQRFGDPLDWFQEGASVVTSTAEKMILGYPSELDWNGVSGLYFQHRTGPFNLPFSRLSGAWFEINNVSTGPGNSGGPVLVRDTDGVYTLAGVLVSGSKSSAGIYVLDAEADLAATSALASANQPVSPPPTAGPTTPVAGAAFLAESRRAVALKDGARRYTGRPLQVPRVVGPSVTQVLLDLSVSAERRGDLDIFVRSPRGRTRVVASANSADTGADLVLYSSDISGPFLASNPRGVWRVFLRDSIPGHVSKFHRARLLIASQ